MKFLLFFIAVFGASLLVTEAADVNVSAQIPSPVSVINSSIELNSSETLADPVNHPLLLTITLLDQNKQPLANKEVMVLSNRGQVDIIEPISKISSFQVDVLQKTYAAQTDNQKDQTGQTDSNGQVSFRITSFIPGQAILKITADSIVELPTQTIKFDPLPFPSNLIITTSLPWSNKEFTIYSPRNQEKNLSAGQTEAKKLINQETKIKLNFWAFALFLLIIIGAPIMIVLNFINLRKIRWMENEQTLLLKKMFPPNFNRRS